VTDFCHAVTLASYFFPEGDQINKETSYRRHL